ncbi:MAG: J domain-containing protein, partial [Pseudomonadota bacterium]
MSVTDDYYNVLGVVPSAENAVIKGAYRALVVIYHPDKNASSEAREKIIAINIAYETLSDPSRRQQYDTTREKQSHNASSSEFDCETPFATDPLEKAWAIAVGFYPSIDSDYNDLANISWRLAFAYKLQLLENQEYANSKYASNKLKTEYLTRYFGKDEQVRDYAEQLIKARELQAAIYLNDIVNVMGTSITI